MGPQLLLTCTLLYSYFFPGRVVDAQQTFIIKRVILSIEPSTDVTRGTNVTVRCKAIISSSSGQAALSREYTIYRDNNKVYTKTSSTSEDLLYQLPEARISNNGNFMCSVNIEGSTEKSEAKMLKVTGVSKPVLHLNKKEVSEGEEVTARCTAPGETGSFFFYIYKDSERIDNINSYLSNSPFYETKILFNTAGTHRIHCDYVVLPDFFKSNKSNEVTVSVKEFPIQPVMVISPQSDIYEGDHLNISCTVTNSQHSSKSLRLYLSQGDTLLSSGAAEVNRSIVALARDPGDFECRLKIGEVTKVTTKTLSVTELFSAPALTMIPAEVFQKDNISLICKSEHHASLNSTKLIYSLDPPGSSLTQTSPGVFNGRALQYDFNYTCAAQAKGILKESQTLTVRPKVLVSAPKISVVHKAVLHKNFTILCQSDTGSLPINYTLLKDDNQLNTTIIRKPSEKAYFTVSVTTPDEITMYSCEARNKPMEAPLSSRLNTTVIIPLSEPFVNIRPNISDISEGNSLHLMCSVEGTPPVTIWWFREEKELLVNKTSHQLSLAYYVERLSKENSGKYHCEAENYAGKIQSRVIDIEVHLAIWKKTLIGGICLLVLLVLVIVCVLYFRSKRGKREPAAELSVKPSSPKSDDSLTVNLTHNTEVYNAATARVDRAAVDSVWSERPPEAASDEVSSVLSSEPDVEYTEVVHPQPVDPARVPLRKGTDTVYSELKNSPHGAADPHDCGSVEYAELSSEQPEISHYSPEVNNYQDLPVPMD